MGENETEIDFKSINKEHRYTKCEDNPWRVSINFARLHILEEAWFVSSTYDCLELCFLYFPSCVLDRQMCSMSRFVSLSVRTISLRLSISLFAVAFMAHHMSHIRLRLPLSDVLLMIQHFITSLLPSVLKYRRYFTSVAHFSPTHPRDTHSA